MRFFAVFLLCIIITIQSFSQIVPCSCPYEGFETNQKPIKSFKFKNSKELVICGFSEEIAKQITYSEFCLKFCDTDTCILNSSALETYTIHKIEDTLYLAQKLDVPIGKNYQRVWKDFFITKYYFKNTKLVDSIYFNHQLKKYTSNEIKSILKKYKKYKQRGNIDNTITLALQLFWCWVSGSNIAEKYFLTIETKFGPFDGAIAEDYFELQERYKICKKILIGKSK